MQGVKRNNTKMFKIVPCIMTDKLEKNRENLSIRFTVI